jgi:UDP-glucose 4-epimerase
MSSSGKSSLVAGGAGFIGVTLIRRLLDRGHHVVVADNFCRGDPAYLAEFGKRILVIEADLSKRSDCERVFATAGPFDEVWHLAANSDIPAGIEDPDIDLRDTFQTTFELLRVMRRHGVPEFHFASSSAIYGDLGDRELHEDIGPLLPISNYGAMKLASEAQASAAAESYLARVNVFRFPNVVGTPATHGVILDFINKLAADPSVLDVLGDGTQQKAYLHVSDLVDAMLLIADQGSRTKVNCVNIGPVDEGVTVRWIAEQVAAHVSPGAEIRFGQGNKGWVGDVPRFTYSTKRLQSLGWSPVLGSVAAVGRAIDEIAIQQGFPSSAMIHDT